MTQDPDEAWRTMLDDAEDAANDGRFDEALQLCDRASQAGDEARYFAGFLRGDVLLEMGDAAGALSAYDAVADPESGDPELDCARGIAMFELAMLPEADRALRSAVATDPELAEAFYTLGLIAELRATGEDAELFREARKLDPERFAAPKHMSNEAFDNVVAEALDALPHQVQEAIGNIPIIIEDLPDPDEISQASPPLSPTTLGLFLGVAPSDISVLDGAGGDQPVILLFKRNLERAFPDREDLVEEIRVTVIHEIGHALGLSEDDLIDRGLH
jgi:predicted Zn-dependent protease with MMP-like domain